MRRWPAALPVDAVLVDTFGWRRVCYQPVPFDLRSAHRFFIDDDEQAWISASSGSIHSTCACLTPTASSRCRRRTGCVSTP
jgi:hypothetical protein